MECFEREAAQQASFPQCSAKYQSFEQSTIDSMMGCLRSYMRSVQQAAAAAADKVAANNAAADARAAAAAAAESLQHAQLELQQERTRRQQQQIQPPQPVQYNITLPHLLACEPPQPRRVLLGCDDYGDDYEDMLLLARPYTGCAGCGSGGYFLPLNEHIWPEPHRAHACSKHTRFAAGWL